MTKEEKKVKAAAYYSSHKEESRVRSAAYNSSHKEERRVRSAAYYSAHKEEIRTYRAANREKRQTYMSVYNAAYCASHREVKRIYDAAYRAANNTKRRNYVTTHKEETRTYVNHRRSINPNFRLAQNLRSRLRSALNGLSKSASTLTLLGCSIDQLWAHLESRFQPGMTRENHGDWHVDHIKPCSSFDLTDPAQQIACFHWSNLQPLWKLDNLRKGSKLCKKQEDGCY